MRNVRLAPAAALLALLLHAPSASAGPLTSASLRFVIGVLQPVSFASTGLAGAGSAQGTLATATWSVGAGAVPIGTVTTATSAVPISTLRVVIAGNDAATFAAGLPGTMRVSGDASAFGFGTGVTILKVPLALGTVANTALTAGLSGYAYFEPWTTGTATAGASGPTAMGANALAGGVGTVVLVTAVDIQAGILQLPAFAFLTLNYAAPEPAAMTLAALGSAGLVALGRRKRRS